MDTTANRFNTLPSLIRGPLNQLFVLLGMTSFAITEPVLTVFGANPTIFFFYDVSTPYPLIIFAVVVALAPAFILWAATATFGVINRHFATFLHFLVVGLLAALWGIQLLKWKFDIHSVAPLIATGIVCSTIVLFSYIRFPSANTWMQFTAIAPFIIVVVFLFSSSASSLLVRGKMNLGPAVANGDAPSVVFIMLDEFPTKYLLNSDGLLDAVWYPNLADFGKEATWYRHYSVLADRTDLSVPSILSGGAPKAAAPDIASFPNNLFTLLAPTHQLTAFELITKLCGIAACDEKIKGDPVDDKLAQVAGLLNKAARTWLERVSFAKREVAPLLEFKEKIARFRYLVGAIRKVGSKFCLVRQ